MDGQNGRFEIGRNGNNNGRGGLFVLVSMSLMSFVLGHTIGTAYTPSFLEVWLFSGGETTVSPVVEKAEFPSLAGKKLTELELHVIGMPCDISTLAFCGLAHERGIDEDLPRELKRIQKFYEEQNLCFVFKNEDAINRRREELIIKAGAFEFKFAQVAYSSESDQQRIEKIVRSFD